jgi:hypothetical protein
MPHLLRHSRVHAIALGAGLSLLGTRDGTQVAHSSWCRELCPIGVPPGLTALWAGGRNLNPLKGTGATDLDSEAWESSKAIAYKCYSGKVGIAIGIQLMNRGRKCPAHRRL